MIKHPQELRSQVFEAIRNGMKPKEIAQTFGITQSTISKWEKQGEFKVIPKSSKPPPLPKEVTALKKLKTQLPLDNQIEADYLKDRWGQKIAINYCKVILSPSYFARNGRKNPYNQKHSTN